MLFGHRDGPPEAGSWIAPTEGGRLVARPPVRRRRWSTADQHYLQTWVGRRPIGMLCRHLQRSERAVRCKLHKLRLNAKVCEGWGSKQLRTMCHLDDRTVLHYLASGTLRLQCAEVRWGPCLHAVYQATSANPPARRKCRAQSPSVSPIGEAATTLHWTLKQLYMAALAGQCRLIHLRVTEASALPF